MNEAEERNATGNGFAGFAGGVSSWFGAWGMQQVLFSWIVVGELHSSAGWVGIAQTSTMLPSLLLLVAGGIAADRLDPRRLLIVLHLLAALSVLGLAAVGAFGWSGLPALIAFGLCIGTIQAFAMPARDTLLSRVAGNDMMHAVTSMTAAQFGSQAVGALVAGLARWTGSTTMLVVQAVVLLFGSFATSTVPGRETERPKSMRFDIAELGDGIRTVARSKHLRTPVVLVVAVGILFVGPFMVIFPLLVRDYYSAGVEALSLILMLFPLGTIAGSLVLRRYGIRRKGLAALVALLSGATMEAVIGLGVSFPAMIALTFAWGLAGSVFINCCRTLYQEAAPAKQRGSVLAIYQLGFMGGAPIGALLSGFVSSRLGLHATLVIAAATMMTIAAVMSRASEIREME